MNILIVDDEPMIRKGLHKMTESYPPGIGWIELAENGEQAMNQITARAPDLILTDIRMPKKDGLELCKWVYETHPFIHMVVISGYADFEYAQRCIQYGVSEYLLKPVDRTDIHRALDKVRGNKDKGMISLVKTEDWIGEITEKIWHVKLDEIAPSLEQWREYCLSNKMTPEMLKAALMECLGMLLKRLKERGYEPRNQQVSMLAHRTAEDLLTSFEEEINRVVQEILIRRGKNMKDPMEEAKRYIDEHLFKEITLEEVAEMVGLTPNYFSVIFKKTMNESFVQYRTNRRMLHAKKLLAIPHYRIIDVAMEVGYGDYPHFTKTFRKVTGYSPTEYRAMLGIK
ncbi:response regulator [Paenibacillus sp. N3.4]|uniref:response regulator n=1 Tax=Paenibacillus sp. N3.4 TaxID=2603222 RepID=UPI0011C92A24|nr:response regulator [Paenibacillus sp. N3.4]TXK80634.1 response regulator [Paenibacillus sp. N3.4]